MKYIKYETILEINWNDHQCYTGWAENTIIENKILNRGKGTECKIAGYYGGEDKDSIVIIQTINENTVDNCFQILKSCIIKIKVVK